MQALRRRGYTVIGPTVRAGAIVYDEIERREQTCRRAGPTSRRAATTASRAATTTRCSPTTSDRSRGRTLPASRRRCACSGPGAGEDGGDADRGARRDQPRYAFLGVRSCDLHAIGILDRVLHRRHARRIATTRRGAGTPSSSRSTARRRAGPASASRWAPGRGPRPASTSRSPSCSTTSGHRFLVEVGSERGAEVLAELAHRAAKPKDEALAQRARSPPPPPRWAATLDTDGIRELLYENHEHPRWEEVAERCLTCGNCTMVCPTCFCTHGART